MGESGPTSLGLMAYLMVVFRGRSRQPRPAGLTLRVPQCYGLAPQITEARCGYAGVARRIRTSLEPVGR